jgi:hypothetical protein
MQVRESVRSNVSFGMLINSPDSSRKKGGGVYEGERTAPPCFQSDYMLGI